MSTEKRELLINNARNTVEREPKIPPKKQKQYIKVEGRRLSQPSPQVRPVTHIAYTVVLTVKQ